MMRRVVGCKRKNDEPMAAYMERLHGIVKWYKEEYGIVSWDQKFMERKFTWGATFQEWAIMTISDLHIECCNSRI